MFGGNERKCVFPEGLTSLWESRLTCCPCRWRQTNNDLCRFSRTHTCSSASSHSHCSVHNHTGGRGGEGRGEELLKNPNITLPVRRPHVLQAVRHCPHRRGTPPRTAAPDNIPASPRRPMPLSELLAVLGSPVPTAGLRQSLHTTRPSAHQALSRAPPGRRDSREPCSD